MVRFVHRYDTIVRAGGGERYLAYACAAPRRGDTWEGWLVFVPLESGVPLSSERETTQPNCEAIEYWASGLSPIDLGGALGRALERGALPQPAAAERPERRAGARSLERASRGSPGDTRAMRRAGLHVDRARVGAPRIRRAPGR